MTRRGRPEPYGRVPRRKPVLLLGCCGLAGCIALELPPQDACGASLGTIDGFDVRLDITLRVSLAARVEPHNPSLLSDINADDGDRAFTPGPISERVDATSQLDVSRGDLGVELSTDGWYDAAYNQTDADHPSATFNPISVPSDRFPAETQRLLGQTIELGDAYVHDKLEIAGVPVSLRIGRQTLLWGESLFFAEDGIAAGQAPVDLIKSASQPLVEANELYLPVTQAVVRVALPASLSIEAYAQFEWRRDRIPGVASYFSTSDILDAGGERVLIPGGGSLSRAADQIPSGFRQFGVALRRDSDTLNLGLYALRYDAKSPEPELGEAPGSYRLAFPSGIDLLGASASTYLGDDTLSGEVSLRRHLPLASRFQPLAPTTAGQSGGAVASGFATGQALQALVSYERQLRPAVFWDAAVLQAEAAATDLLAIESGSTNRLPGTTRFALALQAVFTPTYYHLARDLVLTVPIGFEIGLAGRSSIDPGRDAGTGNVTLGVAATYRTVWQADLSVTHYVGGPALQPLADRDFVAASLQRTF